MYTYIFWTRKEKWTKKENKGSLSVFLSYEGPSQENKGWPHQHPPAPP